MLNVRLENENVLMPCIAAHMCLTCIKRPSFLHTRSENSEEWNRFQEWSKWVKKKVQCRISVLRISPDILSRFIVLKQDNICNAMFVLGNQSSMYSMLCFWYNFIAKARHFIHDKWTTMHVYYTLVVLSFIVYGTDSLSSAIEAEMRTSCPSRYSVVMRSLHWTSSPSGPPLKAFSAILKPDSLVSRPKCTRIWQKEKLQK